MVGVKLLRSRTVGQESAQIDATAFSAFSFARVSRKVVRQAARSSTSGRSYVQNRYPSPLKRFAYPGEPLLYFGATPIDRDARLLAEDKPVAWAGWRPNQPLGRGRPSPPILMWLRACTTSGEATCEDYPYVSACLAPSLHLAAATRTRSAGLSAPGRGLRSLLRRAATLSQARSSAALQGCSATTWASATSSTANRSSYQQSQGARRRPGFFYALSAPLGRAKVLGM